jgi:hypothetical protein
MTSTVCEAGYGDGDFHTRTREDHSVRQMTLDGNFAHNAQ